MRALLYWCTKYIFNCLTMYIANYELFTIEVHVGILDTWCTMHFL